MFKLPNKHKSKKFGEKFDFKFSNFRALQVPRGWDKLVVTVVSLETGKTVAKTGRAPVREEMCRWTESISESVLFSRQATGCQLKFVVASVSSKYGGFLGEAVVELGSYRILREAVPISVPLQKCSHGTVLQVEIQCLTPREKPRESWGDTGSFTEDVNNDFDDMQNKLDISDSSDGSNSRKSVRSTSNHSDGTHQTGEPLPMDFCFSSSFPRYSIDSTEGSQCGGSCSSRSNLAAISNDIGRQDSTGSQSCSPRRSYRNDDSSKSNHSSFNSKTSVSHDHLNQRDVFSRVPRSVASSPLRNAGSSLDLLEAAEVNIQEVRAEARMWEQNARKLMTSLESVQTELQEQSKRQALLEKELSESRRECDGFKDEAEQLKILMAEAVMKHSGLKEVDNVQRELDNELKFQREENANLALQLKKTQESNIELVSILQELEDTIEKQKLQIANMSRTQPKSPDGEKHSHGWVDKEIEPGQQMFSEVRETPLVLADFCEESKNLKLKGIQLQGLENLETTAMHLDRSWQEGNKEIELEQSLKIQALEDCEAEWRAKLAAKEDEIIELEAKLSKSLDEKCIKDGCCNSNREIEALSIKVEELERDCIELTNENLELLFLLKESKRAFHPGVNSITSEATRNEYPGNDALSTSDSEVMMIRSQMCNLEDELNKETLIKELFTLCLEMQCLDIGDKFAKLEIQLKTSKNRICLLDGELSLYRERENELEMEIASLQRQQQMGVGTETKDHECTCTNSSSESHSLSAIELAEILSQLHEQILIVLTNIKKQRYANDSLVFTGCHYSCSKLQSSTFEDSYGQNIHAKAILESFLQLKDLFEKARVLSCDDELQNRVKVALSLDRNSELEACDFSEISSSSSLVFPENLEMKHKPDENTQVLTNKILLMKLSEKETCNTELEVHLSELAKENVGLSVRVSGLEAQLGYLTDERELSNLELQHSESCITNLVEEIRILKCEKEEQEADKKRKLQDMKKQQLEAQEQCDHLKVANTKLQATAESLIDECNMLQKSNGELREQKRELHKLSMVLEAEQRELKEAYSGIFKAVEALEGKYSLLLEEIASKESAFLIELDSLVYENQQLEEKFEVQERLVNQINVEMAGEIKKPERMVAHLSEEMPITHNGEDLTASNTALDLSCLCVEKVVVESQWQTEKNLELSLSTLSTLRMESERKQLILANELAASKQNHEILMADHEKLLELLEDVKSSEGKHKRLLRSLQFKLKASEYEKQQAEDEISRLKVKLQKTALLQNEILSLQRALNEVKFENQRVEASFEMLCGEYEELKAEKALTAKKIASLESAVSKLEECKHRKAALEAKVLRLEGDLTAKEALSAQDAELRNELSRVKRANHEFQRKLRSLEEEMQVYQERAKILEELRHGKDPKQDRRQVTDGNFLHGSDSLVICASAHDKLELPKVDARHEKGHGSSIAQAMDTSSKIISFENELSLVLEANNTKKSKLQNRVLSDKHSSVIGDPLNKLKSKDNIDDQHDSTSTSLERELSDLQERYLQMSLKYAEVEVEREQLMLKLKAVNNGRKSVFP